MTVALIDASPKPRGSTSGILLSHLRQRLPAGVEGTEQRLRSPALPPEALPALQNAGVWVFACPLYVDGLPSHLLACLMELEKQGLAGKTVYAVVNCGFYEGIQAKPALGVFENWCARAGHTYGGGLGIGGGGAIPELPPAEKGPMAPVLQALRELGGRIAGGEAGENRYLTIAFPRFLYRMAAQLGWRRRIKANGGRARDLGRCPQEEG